MKLNYSTLVSDGCKNIPPSFLREILSNSESGNLISFAGGLPSPEFLPVDQLQDILSDLMQSQGTSLLQYAGSQGNIELREWIADRYNHKFGLSINSKMIIITNGSQQAIDLLGKAFINPGNPIIIEKPAYLGAIQAFSAYRPDFQQVTLNDDGIDLDTFKETCLRFHPKFSYLIPNFQNPSGISYNQQKRKLLAQFIENQNIIIAEDDPYGEIYFNNNHQKPIFSYNQDQVIWCGSFSKMISPGIRMGWICAPEKLVPYLLRAKQGADLHTNNLIQQMIISFLKKYDIDKHLLQIRNSYRDKCNFMLTQLHKYFPCDITFTKPQGGMFIWVTLPSFMNTESIIKNSMNQGVVFVPGKSFFTDNSGKNCMRLNFTCSTFEEIETGIKKLGEILVEETEKSCITV